MDAQGSQPPETDRRIEAVGGLVIDEAYIAAENAHAEAQRAWVVEHYGSEEAYEESLLRALPQIRASRELTLLQIELRKLRRERLAVRRRHSVRPVSQSRRTRTRTRERRRSPSSRRVTSRSAGGGDGSDSDGPGSAGPPLVWDHANYGPVNHALARFIVEHEVRP